MVRRTPAPVDVTNQEPIPVQVVDKFSERMRASTPFLLAVLTAVSTFAGFMANKAANSAQKTAELARISDSTRAAVILELKKVADTTFKISTVTHEIANSEKTHRAAQNTALRLLLTRNHIPIPEALKGEAATPIAPRATHDSTIQVPSK